MPDVSVLDVRLYGQPVATLTHIQGDRSVFAFNEAYVADNNRPTMSLNYKDEFGNLRADAETFQRVLPPFFSNLLPEGPLRRYLADRAGVNKDREFFLLWMLGRDLPGALSVHPTEGEALPPGVEKALEDGERPNALRFSLAGVQFKFSALQNGDKGGGLTIPAEGVGGSWIVKLPSQQFTGVPENEFSMMTIAKLMGMDVPEIRLADLEEIAGMPEGIGELHGQALVVKRFDRGPDGPIHIEDFAQVFGLFPDRKYERANYRNIANVISTEAGDAATAEFMRRLIYSALIGNGDMHLKNWSLTYPDRRTAALAPAYDLVSTIPYMENEDTAALKYSRTKKVSELTKDELIHFAAKGRLSEKLILDTAAETVSRFKDIWAAEKQNLPLAKNVRDAIEAHAPRVPIYEELA